MPIVWKTSFEEPLNKLMLSGTVGNSKQLVDTIALLYDISIKQGLPNPPGTPAGPLINGNIIVFKKMLNLYFKVNSNKNQAGVIKMYIGLIKSIILNIKTVREQIKTKSTELKTATREVISTTKEIAKTTKEINKISSQLLRTSNLNVTVVQSKRNKLKELKIKLINLRSKLAKYKIIEIEAKALIDKYKERIIKIIKPKIQFIKDELKKLIRRILFPQTQENKLTLLRRLPIYIKQLIAEYKEKRKEIVDKIQKNVQTIRRVSGIIIKVITIIRSVKNNAEMIATLAGQSGELTNAAKAIVQARIKSDSDQLKTLIMNMVKSPNYSKVLAASSGIMAIIDKYPDKIIPREIKDECRSASAKIPELKYEIELKKQELQEKVKAKFKEKRDELIKSIKPKKGKKTPQERMQELQAKRKEVQNLIKEFRSKLNEIKELILIAKLLKGEIVTITRTITTFKKITDKIIKQPIEPGESINAKINAATKSIKYNPNESLAVALEKRKPGLGSKYRTLKVSTGADLNMIKAFIVMTLIEFLNEQQVVTQAKERATRKIKEVKDKIIQSRNPIQTLLFNKFLKLAIIGYWTGGIMPNLGIVTSPGVVAYRVPMKMSSDSSEFVKNLTRAFMLHTKTVAGTYTIPTPTGPVILPWIGYN